VKIGRGFSGLWEEGEGENHLLPLTLAHNGLYYCTRRDSSLAENCFPCQLSTSPRLLYVYISLRPQKKQDLHFQFDEQKNPQ